MTPQQQEPCTVTLFRTIGEDALQRRVRGEFREMPGMRLTEDQAMRLWAIDRQTCRKVLESLVAVRYLAQDRNGRFVRAHGGY